jgi:hypothetical protein
MQHRPRKFPNNDPPGMSTQQKVKQFLLDTQPASNILPFDQTIFNRLLSGNPMNPPFFKPPHQLSAFFPWPQIPMNEQIINLLAKTATSTPNLLNVITSTVASPSFDKERLETLLRSQVLFNPSFNPSFVTKQEDLPHPNTSSFSVASLLNAPILSE